jgi:uncharacterized Zn finger protein (UPF0148 family)
MRCPRCGDELVTIHGNVSCEQGGMELSQVMATELLQIAVAEPAEPQASAIHWGGEWHCPADGSRMFEIDGRVEFAVCGRNLPPKVLHQMIELHVHAQP